MAIFLVFAIHYIGYTHILGNHHTALLSIFVAFFLNIMIICCPLFFIITGYLLENITYSKCFNSIWKIYNVYLFYALITAEVCMNKYHTVYSDISHDLLYIDGIIGREWYVRAYIMIMIFIPFLMRAWNTISKQEKEKVLIVLILLVGVSKSASDFAKINNLFLDIANLFWPIVYIFIGAYIREYNVKLTKTVHIIVWGGVALTSIYLGLARNGQLNNGNAIDYGRLIIILFSSYIFLLLYNININSPLIKMIIKYSARASLDTYLCALIFEYLWYDTSSDGMKFFKGNILIMVIIIIVTIIIGNIRIKVSNMIDKNPLIRLLVSISLIAVIVFSTSYHTYRFSCKDIKRINENNGGNSVGYKETGCIMDIEPMNLDKGKWCADIYYLTDGIECYTDVSYHNADNKEMVYTECKLRPEENKKHVNILVEKGTFAYKVRVCTKADEEIRVDRIEMYRQRY